MGACLCRPAGSAYRADGDAWADAGEDARARASSSASARPAPRRDPVLAFVGLAGAGKTAMLRALRAKTPGERTATPRAHHPPGSPATSPRVRRRPPAETPNPHRPGAPPRPPADRAHRDDQHRHHPPPLLTAPPPTSATSRLRLRAAGVPFTAVDVPGDRGAFDRADRWRLAIERENPAVTAIVFVVDAADATRVPLAAEELASLLRVGGRPFDEPSGGLRTDSNGFAQAKKEDAVRTPPAPRVVVAATKQDVPGALSAADVRRALGLGRVVEGRMVAAEARGALGPGEETRRREAAEIACVACTATSRASVEAALRGVLGRGEGGAVG